MTISKSHFLGALTLALLLPLSLAGCEKSGVTQEHTTKDVSPSGVVKTETKKVNVDAEGNKTETKEKHVDVPGQ